MRLAMGVEYDGSRYHGWQIQDGVDSVQQQLEQAVSKVADHPVSVQCAGRTDTGVHGIGQVVHFDTEAVRTERNWLLGTNVNLPFDINVNWVKPVPDEFHARFSATDRSYRYVILNRRSRSAIWRDRSVWIHHELDEGLMAEAAGHLVGTHDFSSYRALGCQAKSPVRTISRLDVSRQQDRVIIDITANAFLHHMVRNIAGVLITIGKGERTTGWSREVLEYRDRTLGGVTAQPQGLFLMHVGYPEQYELPDNPPF
ncbi:MAG: tRNA pseudouridine(38-40) synthase TruA [Candidatus Sedimenticola sp. 20ELBAFRAG]